MGTINGNNPRIKKIGVVHRSQRLQVILVPDLAGPFVAHHARPDRCPGRADLPEELAV